MPPEDNIYNIFDRSLYKIGTSTYSADLPAKEVTATSLFSATVDEVAQTSVSGNTAIVQQQAGGTAAGKTKFDNTETGYILGIDSSVPKFYIGNTANYLNWTGTQLIISGNISATTGTIGGFTIDTDALYAGDGATKIQLDTTQGIFIGANTLAAAPFSVTLAGELFSSGGIIIGGIIKTSETVGIGSTGVIMDTDGLRGYDSVLGLTFELPTDGSPPTFSSGIISETIYEINTNAVLRTSSTVGDGSADSAGILINDTGLYGCEANQTLANANVKVLVDGTATFNASIRGGQTDFNTGIGYFLGLSSGDYKFSIGSSTNYLTWDGDNLILKGSFDVGSTGLINNASYTVANLPIAPTSIGFNMPSAYE